MKKGILTDEFIPTHCLKEVDNMDYEVKFIKLIINKNDYIKGELKIFEEDPDNPNNVLLKISMDRTELTVQGEDFFSALQDLRKQLEKRNIQIMCNGAAENVYPSPMQVSMGGGRVAYKLYIGEGAKIKDVVDIFECDEGLKFVDVDRQDEFYEKWLQSILGRKTKLFFFLRVARRLLKKP